MLQPFPVIVGPTAGGKSALALSLARALALRGTPAEIVSADSMLVYRGLDIGTAKPTPAERAEFPHHLIDLVDPIEPFTVDRWLELAEAAIAAIRARGALPLVVGGTHFYVKALLEGLFEGPAADPALRAELAALDPPRLREMLQQVDPAAAARIHANDLRRTIRAIEVHRLTGKPISQWQGQWDSGHVRDDAALVGLDWGVDAINRRINARVRGMVQAGLVEEVRVLWASGRLGAQSGQALGYKQVVDHLEGRCSLDEALERVKIETRRLAKNQRTWLRRLRPTPGSLWVNAEAHTPDQIAQNLVEQWFK